MKKIFVLILAFAILPSSGISQAAVSKNVSFQAEVWADNWFSLYANGKKVGEDSVPITTEKSFNSEKIKFTATYPLTIGLMAKDFVENASGLEYIGKSNQQIGDGGIILQIRDLTTNQIVAYTDSTWRSLVVFKAPLNPECVTSKAPLTDCKSQTIKNSTTWYSPSYKDSSWLSANEFSKEAVGVKDGYFNIDWSANAKLIWSSDLKLDNTILFRKIIAVPKASSSSSSNAESALVLSSPNFVNGGKLSIDNTCEGKGISPELTWTGGSSKIVSYVIIMDTIPGPLRPGEVDIGNHFYLTVYNIPATTKLLPAGAVNVGTLGQNFQGKKLGYTPPCSQGPGVKSYTVNLYALSENLSLKNTEATQKNLLVAMNGKVIATSSLTALYERS
jgi:phosphatidylethanolamine-binding protein (PEBP) family uncharacterized protein